MARKTKGWVKFENIADGEVLSGVNQNPQPIVFSQAMDVDAGTTSLLIEQVSEMGAPECMKLYAIMLNVLPTGTAITINDTINSAATVAPGTAAWVSGYTDMDLSIFVGNNRIPSKPIDISTIHASNGKELVLSTPVYVEWSQRIYVQVQNNDPQTPGVPGTAVDDPGSVSRVKILLIGEVVDEVELRRRLERQKAQQAAQAKGAPRSR